MLERLVAKEICRKDNLTGSVVLLSLDEKPDFPVEAVFSQDIEGNKNPACQLYDKNIKLIPKDKKQVMIVSSQFGCPLKCEYCAVPLSGFEGNISKDGMISQINFLMNTFGVDVCEKAKMHFARMGDPVFNWKNVLGVVKELPELNPKYNFLPSFITLAPRTSFTEEALTRFLEIGSHLYQGNVQLQFSVNSTDEKQRRKIVQDVPIWTLKEINDFAEKNRTYVMGGRRITLNFICAKGYELNPLKLSELVNPELYMVKLTPVNTSEASKERGIESDVDYYNPTGREGIVNRLNSLGFKTIVSVTYKSEDDNSMGCGQMAFLNQRK